MDPASLARHAMAAAGPSIFARKIYDAPVFGGQAKQVKWITTIPLQRYDGYQMNFFIQEDYDPNPGGVFAIAISVRSQAPQTREKPYATSTICNDIKIIQTTYENRAEAYKTLYAFILDMQQLCAQDARYMYVAQEIVNRARALADKHVTATPAQASTEESTEASACELASVLLGVKIEEMTPGELAHKAMDPKMNMASQFTVSGSWGIHYCRRDGTVIRFDPQVDADEMSEEEQKQIEVYSSIVKFNVPEWKARHPGMEVQTPYTDIDILDMGYWLPDGTYEPPDETWRGIHAMNEAVDPALMKNISDKAMWWTEWKSAPKSPLNMLAGVIGHGDEDLDPLKIVGGQSCNLKAPVLHIEGRIGGEVYLNSSRSEHENATYTWTIHLCVTQACVGHGNNIPYKDYAESWFRGFNFVEDEWPQVKDHVEGFYTTVLRPLFDKYLKKGGDRNSMVRDLKRSIQMRWAKYWKPWGRSWRDVYEKSVYYHYNNQPPPEIVARLKELRDEESQSVHMFRGVKEAMLEALTPQELAVQAVGLPVMAGTEGCQVGKQCTVRSYKWVSDHDYKIKIVLMETLQTEHIPGSRRRRTPCYRVLAKPYVEHAPSRYVDLTPVTLFDEIDPKNKGEMYARLWKMFKDIEAAHEAGLEAVDMRSLLDHLLNRVRQEGFSLQET